MTGAPTCGIDIGGTKVAGAVVDAAGTVLAEERVASPATDAEAMLAAVVDLVHALTRDHEVSAVGVGAAGYVSVDRSTVLAAPNIAWHDQPLGAELTARTGLPVVVENDANAAAWGEYRFGAGLDVHHQLMLTVGTGVGGGAIVDGRLLRGAHGIAGEVGHLCVVPDGLSCGCGNRGCLEQYGSGTALVRGARERATADPGAAAALLELADGAVDHITGTLVTRAAAAGDRFATEQLAALGSWLGHGLASLVAVLDPELVVVGGGVAEAGDLLLDPLREAFSAELVGRAARTPPEVRGAVLGNRAGVIGAADLARW